MSEREEAIERLRMLEFTDDMDSHMMLSMIGRAVWPGAVAWTPLTCKLMRDELMDLLDYTDAEIDGVRQECSEMLDRMAEGETCYNVGTFNSWGLFHCSGCDSLVLPDAVHVVDKQIGRLPNKYCPNCGRKVVEAKEDQ